MTSLARQLEDERTHANTHPGPGSMGGSGRGQVTVQFFEKRRRKAWYSRGDDEVCWEIWTVKVTVAEPRTESGELFSWPLFLQNTVQGLKLRPRCAERAKVRKAAETTLHNTIMKIITLVNAHKDHIPPITTSEHNPFPFHININPQKPADGVGWATRIGIY